MFWLSPGPIRGLTGLSGRPLPPTVGSVSAPSWRPVVLFILLAFGGSWLALSPLWLQGFQRSGADPAMGLLTQVCVALAMITPALAALVVTGFRTSLGLRLRRPWRRVMADGLLAIAVPCLLTVAAVLVGTIAGVFQPDLVDFSGLRQMTNSPDLGTGALLLRWTLTTAGSMLLWLPMFVGEELGWQGFLFPRLLPYGMIIACGGASLVFALWHLPTLLMGGQYPGHPWYVAVPAMMITCLLGFPIFAWLRLRSDSIWPAVLAHTFVSSTSVQLIRVFSSSEATIDPLEAGLFGWPGWLVMGGFVAWLALTGRLATPATTRSDLAPGPRRHDHVG